MRAPARSTARPGARSRAAAAAALVAAVLAGVGALAARPALARGATHLLVVSGLGGEAAFSNAFHEWSLSMIDSALAAGVEASNVIYLAEDPARDGERIDGESRKEAVEAALLELGKGAGPDGELWMVIFGHGSARGDEVTVNLPGPDLSAGELAAILDRLTIGNVVVANASSASGDFVRVLSAPGRTIVTATRSAAERHAPMFGRFFSEGFAGNRGDVDKDGRVSLLEAFDYARAAVTREFEADGRMATEHATLDDNGDRSGSVAPEASGEGDGRVASRLFLGAPAAPTAESPELARLRLTKDEIEDRIAELRARRSSLAEKLYLEELEVLLLELARTNEAIDLLQTPETEARPG